ncbi:MAG: ribonuclease HII [Euryarchaeota archaeon]|nr:ribonuclease HII [Euryarchaeota archaeon]
MGLVAGVDEAGKGPVLGSMFVAGLAVEEPRLGVLPGLGVRDSKKLAPRRREALDPVLRALGKVEVVEVTAAQIDELRKVLTMNKILVQCYRRVLQALRPTRAILDAADVNPGRFARNVAQGLDFEARVVAEHRADENHPIVSAASIIAKVRRDASMRALEARTGETLGSGYPSDPVTRRWLEGARARGPYPPYVRCSWKTARPEPRLDQI